MNQPEEKPRVMKIIENELALSTEPARIHKHRRNQSASYHARVQKKWLKRFGQVRRPAVFRIDLNFMRGIVGQPPDYAFYVHPVLVQAIKAAVPSAS